MKQKIIPFSAYLNLEEIPCFIQLVILILLILFFVIQELQQPQDSMINIAIS
jgi:hypothetical protein